MLASLRKYKINNVSESSGFLQKHGLVLAITFCVGEMVGS